MKFEQIIARNGYKSLRVNDLLVYSKYKPLEDAMNFIEKEFNGNAEGYLLIGLGLGYHLYALSKLAKLDKPIFVLYFDLQELILYKETEIFKEIKDKSNITITDNLGEVKIDSDFQVIIPNVWMQALEKNHPLYPYLYDIKMKTVSYKRFSNLMKNNFEYNIKRNDFHLEQYQKEIDSNKLACLVASGPSLNETKIWLKKRRKELYILCVGSALKVLLQEGIEPDALIVTDAQHTTIEQLVNTGYDGYLFYLCTASAELVSTHAYKRCILLQEGYKKAEMIGEKFNYPLIETGGSVATTGFSLLCQLGFKKIVLFGQDLAFHNKDTHATNSTSGRVINNRDSEDWISVMSNTEQIIQTLPNLFSYLKWFEHKIINSKVQVYNTAAYGARIWGSKVIDKQGFEDLLILNNYK